MEFLEKTQTSEEKNRCELEGVDRVRYIETTSPQPLTLIRRRLQLLHPKRDF